MLVNPTLVPFLPSKIASGLTPLAMTKRICHCETVADCSAPGNAWVHPMCAGYATCNNEMCGWVCGVYLPPDSCQGHCGETSEDGSCYCDDWCVYWGDCCADVTEWC